MNGIRVIASVGAAVMLLGLTIAMMAVGAQAIAQEVGGTASMPPLPYDDPSAAGWALVASAVTLVVSLIVAGAKYIGVVLGAEARARLHSAVLSCARAAVARRLTAEQGRAMLPDYLEASIAHTMRRLKPAVSVLDVLFDGYFEVAKGETLSGFVEIAGEVEGNGKAPRR